MYNINFSYPIFLQGGKDKFMQGIYGIKKINILLLYSTCILILYFLWNLSVKHEVHHMQLYTLNFIWSYIKLKLCHIGLSFNFPIHTVKKGNMKYFNTTSPHVQLFQVPLVQQHGHNYYDAIDNVREIIFSHKVA